MKGTPWTPPEVELLERFAGQVPFQDLAIRLRTAARQHGWPERSKSAIIQRLHRMGLQARCRHGDWLTYYAVGELLGCSGDRVAGWSRKAAVRELLKPRWRGKGWYVRRDNWRGLAKKMPQILGGFDADALYLLLEDRDLAEQVAAEHRTTLGDWRVRCIETGRMYSSCSAAARELHVDRTTINLAIRQQRSVESLGMTFEQVRGAA